MSTVSLPHNDKISELLEKNHQAAENKEWDKCEVYNELIADEYDETISDQKYMFLNLQKKYLTYI